MRRCSRPPGWPTVRTPTSCRTAGWRWSWPRRPARPACIRPFTRHHARVLGGGPRHRPARRAARDRRGGWARRVDRRSRFVDRASRRRVDASTSSAQPRASTRCRCSWSTAGCWCSARSRTRRWRRRSRRPPACHRASAGRPVGPSPARGASNSASMLRSCAAGAPGRAARRRGGMAGCYVSVGDKTIDAGSVEDQIARNVEAGGEGVTAVECPGGQEAKQGSTFDCAVTFGDGSERTAEVELVDDDGTFRYRSRRGARRRRRHGRRRADTGEDGGEEEPASSEEGEATT